MRIIVVKFGSLKVRKTTKNIIFRHLEMEWTTFEKAKNFMAPFYGWGSTASTTAATESLGGGSLLFTT